MRTWISTLLGLLALPIPVSANDWSAGVAYVYDGAGNIRQMGTDVQVYDSVGRLVQSDTNGIRSSYTYDMYGNRTGCLRPGPTNCQPYTINAGSNRIDSAAYDASGNVTIFEGHSYTYDAFNMQTRDESAGLIREYIYTAGDERIAIYTPTNASWRWTLRDASGKVLREFTSRNPTGGGTIGTASWAWSKEYVWRDGLLLASRQIEPGASAASTYHYHLDHLGTPRQITDDTNQIVGQHSYHAFGPELTTGQLNEPSLTPLKYTGHERDGELDYMHARYYDPDMGRFLSVDPAMDVKRAIRQPQSWNRYSYVVNNPINRIDPDGRVDQNWDGGAAQQLFPDDRAAQLEFDQRVAKGTAIGSAVTLAAIYGGPPAWAAAGRMVFAGRAWLLGTATLSGSGGREMLGNAMARVRSLSGSMADKANLFEKLSNQISKATNGSWSAARSTAVDGSQVFLGRQGEALIINAEGQLFRTKLGTGLVQEGKNLKVLWDVIRESIKK